MSRNEMHSFASTPAANIPRSKFSMPCNVKFTGNTGKLIPFYVCEVLPGDTFEVSTSVVCRLQTLIHPIFDNIYLDTYYFYVPNRLVWDNWKHFCGEPDRAWTPTQEWTIPEIAVGWNAEEYEGDTPTEQLNNFFKQSFKDSVLDYMGIGISSYGVPNERINALPIRAYRKIYDDWFRDENLEDPENIGTGDAVFILSSKTQWNTVGTGKPYDACKLHDYFTSALPQAQRGNPVELVFGDAKAPVLSFNEKYTVNSVGVTFKNNSNVVQTGVLRKDFETGNLNISNSTSSGLVIPDNLYANLNGVSSGININDLRMAFQVQKFMERSARGGARYIELLKSMFGVTSPDARLQRSEYLGGHRVPINIHQIVNTTETIDTPLGNTGAMSVTSDVHEDFVHSFVEHGFVIGICCVRYKHTYPQGMDRFWSRKTKFDFYWPVFANIGEQPIKNREIFLGSQNDRDLVFGYQEAWADYRYKPNRVMGEMRPGIPNSLASWHLADYYTSQPILSKEWIKEDIMPVNRAIAVQSDVADQFLFDVLINNNAIRPMPLYSIPGLVDHF